MNSAEEKKFAWALVEAAEAFLSKSARSWLCVKIGADEQRHAILELLEGFAVHHTELSMALAPSLWAWVNGFVGSAHESRLRELASQIRLSSSSFRNGSAERVPSPPVRLVASPSNCLVAKEPMPLTDAPSYHRLRPA